MLHSYLKEMNQATFGDKDLLSSRRDLGGQHQRLLSTPGTRIVNGLQFGTHLSFQYQEGQPKWHYQELNVREVKEIFNKWQTGWELRRLEFPLLE